MAGGAIAVSELCRTFYCANHHSLFLGETPPRDLGDTTYKQDRNKVWAGPRSVQQSQGHVAGRALAGQNHRAELTASSCNLQMVSASTLPLFAESNRLTNIAFSPIVNVSYG